MKNKLSPKVVAALAAVAVVAVALVGWFGLVSPQRERAVSLDQEIQETQTAVALAKATVRPGEKVPVGESARALTRAMPERVAMPGVIRQLLRTATRTGVQLDSVTPSAATAVNGYDAVPLDVVVTGRYVEVQEFLHRLRVQAGVAGDGVRASGRLFSVETLNLVKAQTPPRVTATVHLNAFVYRGGAATPNAPAPTDDSSSSVAAGGISQ